VKRFGQAAASGLRQQWSPADWDPQPQRCRGHADGHAGSAEEAGGMAPCSSASGHL